MPSSRDALSIALCLTVAGMAMATLEAWVQTLFFGAAGLVFLAISSAKA